MYVYIAMYLIRISSFTTAILYIRMYVSMYVAMYVYAKHGYGYFMHMYIHNTVLFIKIIL